MCAQAQLTGHAAFMPACRASLRSLFGVMLVVVLGMVVVPVAADEGGEFLIKDAHSWAGSDGQLLDAQIVIRLSQGAKEALENGIPLTFELQAQLVRKHDWLWDSVQAEHVLVRQLAYHALSRSYVVRYQNTGRQASYSRLDDALQAAGTIEKLRLSGKPLKKKHRYEVRLRGSLDIESLPTPVRLLAYVSSDWDMEGEWYAWQLAR